MEEPFKIHTLQEYLNFYIEESERIFSKYGYLKLKEKIQKNCLEVRRAIQEVNQENFFEQFARINTLESEILIILECIELREVIMLCLLLKRKSCKWQTKTARLTLKKDVG